ncbi:MAG: PPOX class F420-dependent oxidoreductase [Thermoproteota archaeon]|nr:PPOX class F420-dependent oxidoreductase [Thermoproteota archaeon]
MSKDLGQFKDQQYISLETYRKNGQPVATPVWFVMDDNFIDIVTRSKTGKVKRVRNNPHVRVVVSDFKGKPKGSWHEGTAQFLSGDESALAVKKRDKKYGIKAKLASLFTSRNGKYVVIRVTLN